MEFKTLRLMSQSLWRSLLGTTESCNSEDTSNNQVLAQPVKGTMVSQEMSQVVQTQPHAVMDFDETMTDIDVSTVARRLQFFRPVFMEAEAFGIFVTRRDTATTANLDAAEQVRLLDVLSVASAFMGNCDEEAKQFEHWLIPSDARDAKPRQMWGEVQQRGDSYRISLVDRW